MTDIMVYLVGAGPGDPDLITVKALKRLRQADVVLYDRLIPLELLNETRAGAKLINVGKQQGTEDLQQSLIHDLLISFAREGKTVCRLKGGDPFVFGRGAEEAEALIEAGIAFEVVPGISSAIAGPGSAGIPVTHREHNHGFLVIAGNKSHGFHSPEWTAARLLARAGGTVVVLMGLGRVSEVADFLMAGGCPGSRTAAVVSNATRLEQEIRVGRIQDIANIARGLASPAIIVFGDVVSTALAGRLLDHSLQRK